MATLDDLRATLEDQAAEATGTPPGGGVPRIVARARRMRARRRAGGAAALAAVVAVALGVAVLPPSGPRGPQPAAGVVPPATMTSLGATYAWTESVTGDDGVATVEVGASDTPVLVSWATSGSDDTVRVTSPATASRTYRTADFADFTVVPGGVEGQVRARAAEGEAGLAVYRLVEPAAGVAGGGLLFRDRVGDGRLLDAAVGEPGETTVGLRVRPGTGVVGFSYACDGGPTDATVTVRFDGRRGGSTTSGIGCDAGARDVGSWTASFAWPAGRELTARATVRADDGPLGSRVRLGVGAYEVSPPPARVGEMGVPGVVEEDGHRWQLVDVRRGPVGARRLVERVSPEPDGTPRLLQAVTSGGDRSSDAVLRTSVGGREGSSTSLGPSSSGLGQVTRDGTRTVLRVDGPVGADVRLALAVYRQAD